MKIFLNPNNPRTINEDKFQKLKNSIKEFPKMLELRPIVVDKDGMILGGNMRYRALQDLGWKIKDEWIKVADQLSDEEKKRFIIEDNIEFGSFDFDLLANEWEFKDLEKWGLDITPIEGINNIDDFFENSDETSKKEKEVTCPECGHIFKI